MLERTSPEYKYNDEYGKKVAKMKGGMSTTLNSKLAQDFPTEDSLAIVDHETAEGRVKGVGKGPGPMGVASTGKTLEELNMILQNTLYEYQYDKTANGRHIIGHAF